MLNPWILEELAAQRRLDMYRTADRHRAAERQRAAASRRTMKRRGGLFATRNKRNESAAPLIVTPRLLQNWQAGR
jgi:hypothetical protein